MDYPKSVPGIGLVNGKFLDENPVNGTPGSLIPSSWGNAVTDEILSVIRSTNVVPAESNNTQLTDAIVSIADQRVSKSVVPASEIVSGVAKIATQAQTNSGVDDTTIVTPKKMAGAVQGQALVAFTTGGTAPLLTLAPVPAIVAYVANQRFQVTFSAAGGVTPTLSVSGIGAKNLKQYNSSGSKVAAVITSGQTSDVVYDGTDFVVLDQLPNAIGITPAQFDNSTNLATTAFIQGVGLQFSGITSLSGTTTLTAAAHAGALIVGTSATAFNVTLPAMSTMPSKTTITLLNSAAGTMTLVCAGGDSIFMPASTTTFALPSFALQPGASLTLVSNGTTGWSVIGMSGVGVGQSWQNVLTSRAAGTTYTNTTGRPKLVNIIGLNDSANRYLVVGGISVGQFTPITSGTIITTVSALVPPGATYSVTAGLNILAGWMELI